MERRQYGRRQIPSPARPSVEDDALAKKESEAFRRKRDLARETEERDHDRKQQVRDLAHFAIKAGIIVVSVLLVVGLFSWGWHLLMPNGWHWLEKDQLIKIQETMSGALIAVLVSDYARKYF